MNHVFLSNTPKMRGLVPKLGTSILVQALLFVIYSFIVSPIFKIQSIKFAFHDKWALFFNWKEIKDSYRVYRSQPRSTVAAYLWGLFVTTIGNFVSFLLLFIPVLGAHNFTILPISVHSLA